MPFQNRSQEEACWAEKEQAEKEGKKPKWNCNEWEHPKRKKKSKKSDSISEALEKILKELEFPVGDDKEEEEESLSQKKVKADALLYKSIAYLNIY